MGERLLKLNFLGKTVDIKVDDVDRCLLIDVINEMVDKFNSRGYELPKYPVLSYCTAQKSHALTDDKTLMKMFEVVEGATIYIWIGCSNKANFIWTLAEKVRLGKTSENVVEPGASKPPLAKLPPKRAKPNAFKMAQISDSHNTPESPPHVDLSLNSPVRKSPRMSSPKSAEPPLLKSPAQSQLSSTFTSPRRSPRFIQPLNNHPISVLTQTNSTLTQTDPIQSQTPTLQSQSNPVSKNTLLKPVPFPHGKKVPKSTLKWKGLWVPPVHTQGTSNVSEMNVSIRSTRKRCRTRVETENCEMGNEGIGGLHISDSDSDGEYEPEGADEGQSESDDSMDYEEGDINDLLNQNYVDGGWELFRTNEWVCDDESYMNRLYMNGEVFEETEFGNIKLKPWQLFVDKDQFRDVLRDFCIQEGFSLVVRRADNFRYTAECADERCKWRIHAARLANNHTWAIKKIRKGHSCDLNLVNNPMCNCEWAASKLLEDIRANPDIKGKTLNSLLWERYGLTMATSTLYRMKGLAMKVIQGGHDESYNELPKYCELLKGANPGSVAFCCWKTIHEPERALQFSSIFISFAAQFRGLISGCRGLVGVDGCHLKGNYGGILLSAVSLDGNNEIFPVAIAVVDSENKTSWTWFFHHLKQILTAEGRTDWTIMSDRQKGVDPSLDAVWPKVPRRYCARHLCKNFKKDYPGLLMHKLFWTVTNAYSEYTFRKALIQLQKHAGLGAVKWFQEVGPLDRWTRWKFDPSLKSDENTNNFVESFNSTIGVDRTYPILTLLEGVRRIAMVKHATRQQLADQWEDGICPSIRQRLRVLTKDSRVCQAYPSGRGNYEIHDGRAKLPVSIAARKCVCGRWQLSGIPCKHGIKAILHEGKDPVNYVSDWFTLARYRQAYSGNISPIPDPDQWTHIEGVPILIPPTMKRSIGRPSRNRRREEGEQRKGKRSATVQCSNCKAFGHNTQT
ncbi:uncharacterized protein LOC110714883 [Chenopodium quinoa]|uniref:uncharacterized protein LOC110714883 n=1 Tax=Chenopodium quinoa TaxID=63459 RepID=UPI000B780D56|nr:uncharacterized protein LOC110714883 [Chenopodium quinoa]